MKRLDFVSNSSSCSFFVYLPNENAVEQFKDIYQDATNFTCSIEKYPGIPCGSGDLVEDPNDIEAKHYYLVYCGNDSEMQAIKYYEGLVDEAFACKDIIVYRDPDAHYTAGKDLPEGNASMEEM